MRLKAVFIVFLLLATAGPIANPIVAQDASYKRYKNRQRQLLTELPFSDKADFENAHKGLIAPLPSAMIKGTQGNLI
jgi:alkyl sulfatase BDS1-like metallo-beta-lactamase superfamily hydrolase